MGRTSTRIVVCNLYQAFIFLGDEKADTSHNDGNSLPNIPFELLLPKKFKIIQFKSAIPQI